MLQVLLRVEALQLDDAAVTAREKRRAASGEKPKAPLIIDFTYSSLCWLMDRLYEGRPIQVRGGARQGRALGRVECGAGKQGLSKAVSQ